MTPALRRLEQYLTRIRRATTFAQLVDIEREVRRESVGPDGDAPGRPDGHGPSTPERLSASMVAYVREEVELRAGPTVYTALTRLAPGGSGDPLGLQAQPDLGIPGIDGSDEDEPDPSSPLQAGVMFDSTEGKGVLRAQGLGDAPIEDEDAVEALIDRLAAELETRPIDPDASNSDTEALLTKPGFLDAVAVAEAEEAGRFVDVPEELQGFYKRLANTGSLDDLRDLLMKSTVRLQGLEEGLRGAAVARIQERHAILHGVAGNETRIAHHRQARSMGITAGELSRLEAREAALEMPLVLRSVTEVLRDSGETIRKTVAANGPDSARVARMHRKIQARIAQRLADKRAAEELLRNLTGPSAASPPGATAIPPAPGEPAPGEPAPGDDGPPGAERGPRAPGPRR